MLRDTHKRIASWLLAGTLSLAPAAALGEVYKCTVDGQVTYSSEPCGKDALKVESALNVAPAFHAPSATAAPSTLRNASFSRLSTGNVTMDNLLEKVGITDETNLTTALLILLPISILIIFYFTRKSESRK